ncbi:universal stress protein [Streptomyces sp. NBC_01549]|nr:universal stress protein [Streptomyces sp. NBC_01549]
MRFAFREAEACKYTLDVVRAWRCPSYETTDHPRLADEPQRYHEERASALLDAALHDAVADHPGVRVHRTTGEGPARKVRLHRSAAADLVVIRRGAQTGVLFVPSRTPPAAHQVPGGCGAVATRRGRDVHHP